jgi:hypothetical protein
MCKCGNQGCAVREARGLVPFCQMSAPAPRAKPGFDTMEACKAAHPTCGALFLPVSSLHSGGSRARRWFPVAA